MKRKELPLPIVDLGCTFMALRILHAAARLVSGTGKLDQGLYTTTCTGSTFQSASTIQTERHYASLLAGKSSEILLDCCTPVSEVAGRRRLRSASRQHLTVPRYRLNTFGRRAFSVAGPASWNSLPDCLHGPTLIKF